MTSRLAQELALADWKSFVVTPINEFDKQTIKWPFHSLANLLAFHLNSCWFASALYSHEDQEFLSRTLSGYAGTVNRDFENDWLLSSIPDLTFAARKTDYTTVKTLGFTAHFISLNFLLNDGNRLGCTSAALVSVSSRETNDETLLSEHPTYLFAVFQSQKSQREIRQGKRITTPGEFQITDLHLYLAGPDVIVDEGVLENLCDNAENTYGKTVDPDVLDEWSGESQILDRSLANTIGDELTSLGKSVQVEAAADEIPDLVRDKVDAYKAKLPIFDVEVSPTLLFWAIIAMLAYVALRVFHGFIELSYATNEPAAGVSVPNKLIHGLNRLSRGLLNLFSISAAISLVCAPFGFILFAMDITGVTERCLAAAEWGSGTMIVIFVVLMGYVSLKRRGKFEVEGPELAGD